MAVRAKSLECDLGKGSDVLLQKKAIASFRGRKQLPQALILSRKPETQSQDQKLEMGLLGVCEEAASQIDLAMALHSVVAYETKPV